MSTSAQIINPTEGQIDLYSGAFGDEPDIAGEKNVQYIDLGTTAADANSAAQAFKLQFPADFDHSVYSNIRVWCANRAFIAGHTLAFEGADDATMPLISITDPLNNGIPIPGNDLDAIALLADGAASGAGDIYDITTRAYQNMLLQVQLALGAQPYDQTLSNYAPPILFLESARTKSIDQSKGHIEDNKHVVKDLCVGANFTFSRVQLFIEITDDPDQVGVLHLLDDATNSALVHTGNDDHIEWGQFKPEITVQRARSGAKAGFNFKLGGWNPILQGLCEHTQPIVDLDRQVIRTNYGAKSSRVRYCSFVVRHSTLAGHLVTFRYPRCILKANDYTPGSNAYAEQSFTVEAQVACIHRDRILRQIETSISPIDVQTIPLVYASVA